MAGFKGPFIAPPRTELADKKVRFGHPFAQCTTSLAGRASCSRCFRCFLATDRCEHDGQGRPDGPRSRVSHPFVLPRRSSVLFAAQFVTCFVQRAREVPRRGRRRAEGLVGQRALRRRRLVSSPVLGHACSCTVLTASTLSACLLDPPPPLLALWLLVALCLASFCINHQPHLGCGIAQSVDCCLAVD